MSYDIFMMLNKKTKKNVIKPLNLGEQKCSECNKANNQFNSCYTVDDALEDDKTRLNRLRSNHVPENQKECVSNVNLRKKQFLREKQLCKTSTKRLSRSYDNIYLDYSKKSKLTINQISLVCLPFSTFLPVFESSFSCV